MDRRYLAGFFDGEGCIHSQINREGRLHVRISISQKKAEVLYEIQRYLEMGNIHPHGGPSGSLTLTTCGKGNVRRFIRLVYPYSVVKRRELAVAWIILRERHAPSGPSAVSFHERLRALKR